MSASPWDPHYRIQFCETKKDDGRRDTHGRALVHWEAGFSTFPKKITSPVVQRYMAHEQTLLMYGSSFPSYGSCDSDAM